MNIPKTYYNWYGYFGASVALDGGLIAVGAPKGGYTKGCVFIFRCVHWVWIKIKTLQTPDKYPDNFGYAIDLSGKYLVVGAPYADSYNKGKAWVLYYTDADGDDWSQPFDLTDLPTVHRDYEGRFGWSVAVESHCQYGTYEGVLILVGNPGIQIKPAKPSDKVWVFVSDPYNPTYKWKELDNISPFGPNGAPPDYPTGELFGYDVDVDGNTFLIGAPWYDGKGTIDPDTGAAYIVQPKI